MTSSLKFRESAPAAATSVPIVLCIAIHRDLANNSIKNEVMLAKKLFSNDCLGVLHAQLSSFEARSYCPANQAKVIDE
jgi:hypothetical protein